MTQGAAIMQEKLLEAVGKAKRGEQQAATDLYYLTERMVYFTALKIVGCEDTARDIVQDTYIRVFSELSKLHDDWAFIPWIKSIVINRCKDHMKKHHPVLFASDEDETRTLEAIPEISEDFLPEEYAERREKSRLVMKIVDALPETQRMAVILYYFDGLSVSEAAQIMEVSEGTVKSRLNYARKKIKDEVEKLEKEGTKLYAIPVFLLSRILQNASLDYSLPQSVAGNILAESLKAAPGSSGTPNGSPSNGSFSSGMAMNAGDAAIKAGPIAKHVILTFPAKVIAIVIAAALIVSVAFSVRAIIGNKGTPPLAEQVMNTPTSVLETPTIVEPSTVSATAASTEPETSIMIAEEEISLDVTELDLTYRGISDLTPLASLTKLQKLYLSENEISDITPLSTLTNLQVLDLGRNRISDLTPLSTLTALTDLRLYSNRIRDITPLASLTNMHKLSLYSGTISDIAPLASLTKLQELNLGKQQISNLAPLADLINLQILTLSENEISDITPLTDLSYLQILRLDKNQISDITPLSSLTALTELMLDSNNINDLTPLLPLTNLTKLLLRYNQVNNLLPLNTLTNISFLALDGNGISDITLLEPLTNLQFLYLSNNTINDLTPLTSLTNLYWLVLSDNEISDLSPLGLFLNLDMLTADNNRISDLVPLAHLTNLTELNLIGNEINDVTPLANLTKMHKLRLSGNEISELQIEKLQAKLPNCDIVTDR